MAEARFLLDTNTCIYLLKGVSESARVRLQDCAIGEVVTSAIAFAEVMLGVERYGGHDHASDFFNQVPVLPFDEAAAQSYANLPFKRQSFDRLIAAQALALGLTVVTRNTSDFKGIAGLRVEDWTK